MTRKEQSLQAIKIIHNVLLIAKALLIYNEFFQKFINI